MSRTVFITGATGFVGSALVEHYAELGWDIHGTFRDPIDERDRPQARMALYEVDLQDRIAVGQLVSRVKPDVVHHLAAQSSAALSFDDPMGTLTANVRMQYNLLEAVRTAAPDARVMVVGSCDEYGDVAVEDNPVVETQELRPLTPYALSKVAQDLMGWQYAAVHGMTVVRVRPFMQLGPRRADLFAAGSFARQVAEIRTGLREAVIQVGNIDLQRDFTDVRDVARACALAADSGQPGEVYNIASGTAHTLRDVLRAMLDAAGVEAEIVRDERRGRKGEPPSMVGDATKLRLATGWRPEISFNRSVADTLTYWQDRVQRALIGKAGE